MIKLFIESVSDFGEAEFELAEVEDALPLTPGVADPLAADPFEVKAGDVIRLPLLGGDDLAAELEELLFADPDNEDDDETDPFKVETPVGVRVLGDPRLAGPLTIFEVEFNIPIPLDPEP